jgi:hypothetical protein
VRNKVTGKFHFGGIPAHVDSVPSLTFRHRGLIAVVREHGATSLGIEPSR